MYNTYCKYCTTIPTMMMTLLRLITILISTYFTDGTDLKAVQLYMYIFHVNFQCAPTLSHLLISAPRGVYYFFVVDFLSPSVCHGAPSNCFFFCFSMESSHFWPSVLHVALYKTVSIFDLGPLTPLKHSNWFFFFVSRWNRTIFWQSVPLDLLYKKYSSIFDLGPLTCKIYSPIFGTKSPLSRLVWQIDRRCLSLLRGSRGWPISMESCKMLWGRPLLPRQRNLG